MEAFWGMHVSPAKHSYAWLPRKSDYWIDRHTEGRTDRCRTKWSLCATMLRRRHKKEVQYCREMIYARKELMLHKFQLNIFYDYKLKRHCDISCVDSTFFRAPPLGGCPIVITLSVCASVCPSANFNIVYNFFTVRNRTFIFGMSVP